MKMSWDEYFIGFACWASKRSTCIRKQVGAVLVRDKRIISTGYNGVLPGAVHCIDYFKNLYNSKHINEFESFDDYLNSEMFYKQHSNFSRINELHAELNALTYATKDLEKCELFVTLSPCYQCSKLILANKISRVVYLTLYDRETDGLELLKKNGVSVEHFGFFSFDKWQ
jgi:dCMP deaminase